MLTYSARLKNGYIADGTNICLSSSFYQLTIGMRGKWCFKYWNEFLGQTIVLFDLINDMNRIRKL